jgi:hypothetical protein
MGQNGLQQSSYLASKELMAKMTIQAKLGCASSLIFFQSELI